MYIGFFQTALFSTITGHFVEEAMKKAIPDRETMMLFKRAEEVAVKGELKLLFDELPREQPGRLVETNAA